MWRLLILVGLACLLFRYAQRQGWIDDEMTLRMRAAARQSADCLGRFGERSSLFVIARSADDD